MDNKKVLRKILLWVLLAALLVPLAGYLAGAAIPVKSEKKSDIAVYSNTKAKVDASSAGEGYLTVTYLDKKDIKLKVKVFRQGSVEYIYDLNCKGVAETFPLTDGDGSYTVAVFENISGTKYSQAFSTTVNVKLRDAFLPFLYPNQFVNYTAETKAVIKAAELSKDATDQLDTVRKVYAFVTSSLTYDKELARTVQPGYLPDLDKVLEKKKGICFDYASMMSGMLRSVGIPCKLVIGYAGEAYHAWINVYIEGEGWLDKVIYFDGESWKLMDPTFASSLGTNADKLKKYIGDGSNYTAKFSY